MPPRDAVNRFFLRGLQVHLQERSAPVSSHLSGLSEDFSCFRDSAGTSKNEHAHCSDTQIGLGRDDECLRHQIDVENGICELKARNLFRYVEQVRRSGMAHWRRNGYSGDLLNTLNFRATFCDGFRSGLPADDCDGDGSSVSFTGDEINPTEATAESVVTETGPDLIDDFEVNEEDVLDDDILGAGNDETAATLADTDGQQGVTVSAAGHSQLDYVDVETCSDEDMEEKPVPQMVPPVFVTYVTSSHWERHKKAETFSYTAELAMQQATEGLEELDLSEPRSDPDGRSYLHILTVDEILHIMDKVRAKDVEVLPVRDLCEWTDHLVFATGRSDKHLRGIADAVVYQVKRRSKNVDSNAYPTVEGRDSSSWVVVDCGSVVVHVFDEDARKYYNLEDLWRVKRTDALEG